MLNSRAMNWKRMLSCEKSVDSNRYAIRAHARQRMRERQLTESFRVMRPIAFERFLSPGQSPYKGYQGLDRRKNKLPVDDGIFR